MLTGSAVAILQICVRKVSVDWTGAAQRDAGPRCAHAQCSAAASASAAWLLPPPCDSTPLLQTKAWRAPRLEGSVRQRAAARTPNFSVLHVSSLVSKAPISARRYCSLPRPVRGVQTSAVAPLARPGVFFTRLLTVKLGRHVCVCVCLVNG